MKQNIQKGKQITVLSLYDPKDKGLYDQLQKFLFHLFLQEGVIQLREEDILPGSDRSLELYQYVQRASLILFLVSSDFMATHFHKSTSVQQALARHEAGQVTLIPILLRPVNLEGTLLASLQCLPLNDKPVTKWENRDEAFLAITKGLQQLLSEMKSNTQEEPDEGKTPVKPVPRKVLLGLAIDLSESMKQNIKNNTTKELSRLEGFQRALNKFLSHTKKQIEAHKKTLGEEVSVFVYGFGLQIPDLAVCDLLTLQKYVKKRTPSEELKKKLEADVGKGVANFLKSLFTPYVLETLLTEAKEEVVILGDTTVLLGELSEYFPENESYWDAIEKYIYGKTTPLLEALEEILARFERSGSSYTHKILCIISDGLPTDELTRKQTMEALTSQFRDQHVTIASCFVTNSDQADPYYLYSIAKPEWKHGEQLLFKLSSQLPASYLSALKSQWKKGPKGMGEDLDTTVRLFVQANHSSNLEKFLSEGILPLLGEDGEDRKQ